MIDTNVKQEKPLVSIAMPTYNRAHMIGQAIDAILNQTYSNLQIIIVNDGSQDNTQEILADYVRQDSRIEVINKQNEGIPDTVNRGWREAKGKYVTWTSDDNLYYPKTIETMVNFLEEHSNVGLVYTDCRYIDGEGNEMFTRKCPGPETLKNDCPIMGSLLFRRSIFDEVEMFRRQWIRVHDYDFYRRVWVKYPIAHIPEVLYDYRMHQASMTGDRYAMSTEHAKLLESVAKINNDKRSAWGRCWHDVARQAQRDNQDWKAIYYYLKATVQQPSRFGVFWEALWKTSYNSLPLPVRNSWRNLKKVIGISLLF